MWVLPWATGLDINQCHFPVRFSWLNSVTCPVVENQCLSMLLYFGPSRSWFGCVLGSLWYSCLLDYCCLIQLIRSVLQDNGQSWNIQVRYSHLEILTTRFLCSVLPIIPSQSVKGWKFAKFCPQKLRLNFRQRFSPKKF